MDFRQLATVVEPVAGVVLGRSFLGMWLRQIAFAGDLAIVVAPNGNPNPDSNSVDFIRWRGSLFMRCLVHAAFVLAPAVLPACGEDIEPWRFRPRSW